MGTNYYVVPNRPSIEEPIHIGKSSMGWMFLFQDANEPYRDVPIIWHSYWEIKDWLHEHAYSNADDYVIINEYDEIVPFDDFIELVERKQEQFKDNPDNFTHCRNVDGYRFTEGEFC